MYISPSLQTLHFAPIRSQPTTHVEHRLPVVFSAHDVFNEGFHLQSLGHGHLVNSGKFLSTPNSAGMRQ